MNRWTLLGVITALIIAAAIVLVAVPGKTANAPAPDADSDSTTGGIQEAWFTTRGNGDIIRGVSVPAGTVVSSPLVVRGEARGNWFFEGSFPIALTDWDGRIIAQVPAQAQSDWMTTDWVEFEATLEFVTPMAGDPEVNRGTLILQKDNASGLPEHDDAFEVPVVFE